LEREVGGDSKTGRFWARWLFREKLVRCLFRGVKSNRGKSVGRLDTQKREVGRGIPIKSI